MRIFIPAVLFCLLPFAFSQTVDFEDIPLGTNGFDNGADGDGGFLSGGVGFNNTFDDSSGFDFWTGFSISNINDTNTPGFLNQFAAFSGTGRGGSGQYAVVFENGEDDFLTFNGPTLVNGFYVNNTTYAALVMRDGDPTFGLDPFGGPSGTEPDTFRLTVEGRDAGGLSQGTVDFYLGDFRDPDPANDVIVDDWAFVDLTPLGDEVETLHFDLESTDTFMGFNNTPNYFAVDDITFEPKTKDCALSGVVWNDLSNDGDPGNDNLAVLGFVGAEVQLLDTNGVVLSTTVSVLGGAYCLDPEPGDYIVRIVLPEFGIDELTIASTPTQYVVSVTNGMVRSDLNFGGLEVPCQLERTVVGFVWSDLDNDGDPAGNPLDVLGIENVQIIETDRDGLNPRVVAVTDSSGFFQVDLETCSQIFIEVPAAFNGGAFNVPVPSRYVFDVVNAGGTALFPVVPQASAAELVRQEATVTDEGVEIAWESGVELDHLGYQVVWVAEEGADAEVITERLMLGGSADGAAYSVFHEDADGSGAYFLEDISTDLEITRHEAIDLFLPAPPVEGELTTHVAVDDALTFRSVVGRTLITGFSAVPEVRAGHQIFQGEVLETESGFGVYLGLPAGIEVTARVLK